MIPITPTAAFPSPFLPPKRVPRLFYRASHRFVNAMLWKAFREKTNQARALFRMPPRKKVWTEQPMMYGVSPTLLDTPRDWPGNVYVCGQWLASSAAWAPPPELANFLAAGEPPIYIGFGSMTGFDSTHLLDALVKAMAGRRALFYPGWSGITSEALPGNFFAIGDTPHDWLFSRISAVVHHGGSGTSHSATRAGAPSIVIPFAGDQFFRAERLRQAGVAPDPVDGRRPSADAIERALAFVADARVCERARALGEAMRAENGVANAVALIERIVATWKSGAAKSAIRLS